MAAIPFGNYELVERIAEGGMAEVWRARSLGVAGFEKAVVIKRVLPSLLERPGFAELLVREAKIAARLSHPNVVQIYDLGEQDGSYFIAMELLRGRDLAAALSARGPGEPPLDLGLRLWIAAEVAKALDYAHRARFDDGKPMNIVHRDVSPQNVLLGYEGEVKVADFGIARADEPGLGRGEDPKILRGKYAYMSPEQARGESLDRRSDIFSFGILLFELATRRRMFRGMSSAQTLEMVRAEKLPPYERHLPLPDLAPLLARALAPARADRYGSAGEIHAELMKLLFRLGRPVGATDLAAAMQRMFPTEDPIDPNKLRVDLMERAYDDATAASDPGRDRSGEDRTLDATSQTRALPRRRDGELRRLAFLAARLRPGEEMRFADAVARTGGEVVASGGEVHLAAFGREAMERAVGHAVRGALEVRRLSRLEGPERLRAAPAMVVVRGEGRVIDGVLVEPSVAVDELARALLGETPDDEVRVAPELAAELGRDFRCEAREGALLVQGFRTRRDRDAGSLRQRAPLVGRRDLLRELSALLIDAAAGRGSLAHLVGEPGIGKSRLLAELRAAAAPRDFVFVHGRADETDAERAFGAFGDLVMDLCGIEPEDGPAARFEKVERMRVLGLGPREVRLLGELIGLAYPVPTGARLGRPRGVELALALRKALRALSRDRVVVLALEDLQWMDDATRQVLPLLVDGLVPGRVAVLVTRRPGASGPLPRGGRTLRIEPLERDAVGRLLAHHLGARAVEPELAAHALGLTAGVPAWIELLAEPLREAVAIDGGLARRSADVLPEIEPPAPLRATVAARLERLRARERSMLRVIAALEGDVDVKLVCHVEGLIESTERAPLRRLWASRLVVGAGGRASPPERVGPWGGHRDEAGLPSAVRVPGELMRRAILAELDPGELARLHARIVATLERNGAHESLEGLERLAHHAERSVDGRRAPDYHVRAAQLALELGDRARASHHYAEAARLRREASGDAADATAFELGLEAAAAALDAGASELAGVALAALDAAAARAEPVPRVQHGILRARHARQRLDGAAAIAALTDVEPLFDAVPPALRAEARTLLARTCVEHGDPERARAVTDALVDTTEDAVRGTALALRATALARLDDLDGAEGCVNEALALAARLGEASLRYASLAALAGLVEARGDCRAAAVRYREAAEVGEGVADVDELGRLHACAAVCALAAGDLPEATRRADDAGRLGDRARGESGRLVVAALRAALAIREHPDASYVPGLVRSVERLEQLGRAPEAAAAVEMLAHAHLALGDPAAAARTLARAAAHAERAGYRSYARRLRERGAGLSPP